MFALSIFVMRLVLVWNAPDYLGWLRNGEKSTTIRRRKGGIEWPVSPLLNLWQSSDEKRVPDFTEPPKEKVEILKIEYVRFGELNNDDAKRDGFKTIEEMKQAFRKRIYPDITLEDWITLYHLKLV